MDQHISQEEIRCIIISDMVKKTPALKWICSVFEVGLRFMWRYTLITNMNSLPHETDLVASQSFINEMINMVFVMKPCNIIGVKQC